MCYITYHVLYNPNITYHVLYNRTYDVLYNITYHVLDNPYPTQHNIT